MDKNTLFGLLLMGLVVFGFLYLQKPTPEQIAQQKEQAERQAEAARQTDTENNQVLTIDSISPQEVETIRSTVREFGVVDSVAGQPSYRLTNPQMSITLSASGELGGSVNVPGSAVPLQSIISHDYGQIPATSAVVAVKTLRQGLLSLAKYQGFAKYISGDSTTVKLTNEALALEISNKGAVISSAKLLDKKYVSYDSTAVSLLSPDYGGYSFTLTTATQRFETSEFYFKPVAVSDTAVTMAMDLGDGAQFAIRYTLPAGKSYTVQMDVLQQGMNKVIPPSVASMDFTWIQKMPRNEAGRVFEERNSSLYYRYSGGGVDHLSENSDDSEQLNERVRWIGYKNQFFSAVLIANNNFNSAELSSTVLENDPSFIKRMESHTTLDYSASLAQPASFTFILGPNLYPLLSDLENELVPETDLELTKLIPLGWSLFRWINTLIVIPVFTFLGKFITNYGVIILILTLFIKLILFPFTYKSYMSQARMRVLSPEIKAINEKYPGKENAMKRQQETMALYSRAGASPFSGCLPMLLQMPILIAMFNFFPSAIELRGEPFLWAHDLSAPDAIVSWTANIPLISSTFGNHISLFCLLMTVVNVIYAWYNMQNQPGGNAMPGMKWMSILMPLMFLVFFNNYASGLSYYYFLSLLITIIQMWIFRKVVSEEKVRARMAEAARKPKKKSGFMARLEEAQKRQQQLLREQERQRSKGRR